MGGEDFPHEWTLGEKISEGLREEAERQADNPVKQRAEPLTLTMTPPTHHCGTHGEHPHWVTVYIPGQEKNPTYCTYCLVDFLNAQSIGKVLV